MKRLPIKIEGDIEDSATDDEIVDSDADSYAEINRFLEANDLGHPESDDEQYDA